MIVVKGPCALSGELKIHGAKNSTLPLLAASVLCKGDTVLKECPNLSDVRATIKILKNLGMSCKWQNGALVVNGDSVTNCEIPHHLMEEMRSSIVFLGAIVARMGEAKLSFPGGCEIGARPIDLHISSLKKLGIEIEESHGQLICTAPNGITGNYISLSFPSVGATENIILAAAVSNGTTVIQNAAKEPEIIELANYINSCGGKIFGAGESYIVIEGVSELNGTTYTVMADRIVAATYMACGAMTGGEILLKNSPNNYLKPMLSIFEEAGCKIVTQGDNLYLKAPKRLKSFGTIRTMPYPGFPTDAQAPIMAMATVSNGTTMFIENIFESRYKHVAELLRLGAKISVEGRVAVVEGVRGLSGAPVKAFDLRGGAAMVAAGLVAQGITSVDNVKYIDRGYQCIEKDLTALGGNVTRI